MKTKLLETITVLPSQDVKRDIEWHLKYTGFEYQFGDDMYAEIRRDGLNIHLQWHADNEEELGPSPTIAMVSLGAKRSFQCT